MRARAIAAIVVIALLPACTTARSYATCDNARIAAQMAQRTVDRFCPIEAQ